MGEWIRRLRYLLTWRRRNAELADEMEFHREMARRARRNNFGNTLRLREESGSATYRAVANGSCAPWLILVSRRDNDATCSTLTCGG